MVVDVSNPSSPVIAGSCDSGGGAHSISISGNYAYVADGSNGLAIVDISNPSSPILKGGCDTDGAAFRGFAVQAITPM